MVENDGYVSPAPVWKMTMRGSRKTVWGKKEGRNHHRRDLSHQRGLGGLLCWRELAWNDNRLYHIGRV